jgi:hypothetical protein
MAHLRNAHLADGRAGSRDVSGLTSIAERAADLGARYVPTFVDERNVPALKACERSGFHPHMLHHRTQMCFGLIRRDRFEA